MEAGHAGLPLTGNVCRARVASGFAAENGRGSGAGFGGAGAAATAEQEENKTGVMRVVIAA